MDDQGTRGAGRYAPSPTGDLHLGNLRTAVIAWLTARSTDRSFVLRIEDLDAARVRPGVRERQVADLTALGVTFDGAPVLQSARSAAYATALAALAGHTYECFCSRREIAAVASAPNGQPDRYPGTCRRLTESDRASRRQLRTPALRLAADGRRQAIVDLRHGVVEGAVDDIVLRRRDGVAAYHLAAVVDDAAAGVDQVVRGEDLLAAAVSQSHLAGLLGLATPTYAHIPLAINPAGTRLAKRDGAVTMADLAAVQSPVKVLGMIANSIGRPAPRRIEDLLPGFAVTDLPAEPWVVGGPT